jgi:hypothetical protein
MFTSLGSDLRGNGAEIIGRSLGFNERLTSLTLRGLLPFVCSELQAWL